MQAFPFDLTSCYCVCLFSDVRDRIAQLLLILAGGLKFFVVAVAYLLLLQYFIIFIKRFDVKGASSVAEFRLFEMCSGSSLPSHVTGHITPECFHDYPFVSMVIVLLFCLCRFFGAPSIIVFHQTALLLLAQQRPLQI